MSAVDHETLAELRKNAVAAAVVLVTIMLAAWLWTVILRTGSTISVTDNTTEEAYHG